MLCQEKNLTKRFTSILFRTFLLYVFLLGCSDPVQQESTPRTRNNELFYLYGYGVPVLGSAKEQLNYALSRFSELEERKAALEAVGKLFPKARIERAEAELELAYLSLGDDFRMASESSCRQAISKYESILREFPDLSPVCAKARWYIAWIYMDLLHDKRRGIENYKRVVAEYPHEGFLPSPRLHWQEIFARQARRETTFLLAKEQWAALALLELARNLNDPKEKIQAVEQLMSYYPASRAVVYGLMILLERHPVSQQAIEMAKEYLASGNAYLPLAVYVRRRLQELSSGLQNRRK